MPRWDVSEQGSVGWLKARLGVLTASRMAAATDFLKTGKESSARRKLKIDILSERLTDMATEMYVNSAMQWGIEQEPNAREQYECLTGNLVQLCGLALHDEIEFFGASPDGLVSDGLIEIKCPTTPTYLEWYLAGEVPETHKPQMLAQLAVTGRKWCDFVAYDPRLPQSMQLFCKRFTPKREEISAIETAAKTFLAEVEEMFDKLVMNYESTEEELWQQ